MENNTKFLLASVINRFPLEVVYFICNNRKERLKKLDLKVMIRTDELQIENNYLQKMLSKCEIRG